MSGIRTHIASPETVDWVRSRSCRKDPARHGDERCRPLIRDNIDTDIIIPSREIRSVTKTGLADGLFAGWRYRDAARTPDSAFALNRPVFRNAAILFGGNNFGCGSSREQDAWALAGYGIRAIIAPSFNPIFRRNCIRNGILPAAADPTPIAAATGERAITIDLAGRTIFTQDLQCWLFDIDQDALDTLAKGLDEVETTRLRVSSIALWRSKDRRERSWLTWITCSAPAS